MIPMTRLNVLELAVALAVLVMGAEPVRAQSRGTLAGVVADRSGGMLAGATVELSGDGPVSTFTTGQDGQFRFVHLPPGAYRLTASKPGFQPASRTDLTIGVNEVLSVSLTLDIEGVEQAVDVPAPRRQAGSRVSFTHDELARLPTPRDPAALLPSVPGVVSDRINVGGTESHQPPQFVFRGSRILDTSWSIDGVVVSDRQTGSPPGFHDLEAFEEVQFAPASGDITQPGSGLAVSMVVRSGTNQICGTARGTFTGAGFQASNLRDDLRGVPSFLTADIADHAQQIGEYGADLGGPVRPGRAWFFASASRQDVRVFRQAGGAERTVLTSRTSKVNWQATPRDMVNWVWVAHGVTRLGVNPAAFRSPVTARQNQSTLHPDNPFNGLWKVEAQRSVLPTLFVTARYAYYGTGFQNISIGTGPAGVSPRLGETVGATSSTWSLRPQHSVAADASYFRTIWRTSHQFRLGTSWQRTDMFNRTLWPGDGVVAFDNSPADQRARIHREQLGRNRLIFVSAYVNDSVSTGRLTVDVGLRYDHQRAQALSSSPAANPAFPGLVPVIAFKGDMDRPAWIEVSPRATLSYALDSGARHVLRGSIGRYASQLPQGIVAQTNPTNTSAWIEYPWEDRNGDRLAQPNEVRVDLPYLAFDGFNPSDPAAAVSQNINDPSRRWRGTTAASLAIELGFAPKLSGALGYNYARHTRWPSIRWQGLTADDYAVVSIASVTLPDGTPVSIPVHAPDPQKIHENGSRRLFITNDSYYSTYHGLEASLVKRLSDGWMLRATGAWNNSRSFYPQGPLVNSVGNPTRLDGSATPPLSGPIDPLVHGGQVAPATMTMGGGGTVFLNARWHLSVDGAYALPWGLEAAARLFGRQGTPSPYVLRAGLGRDGNRAVLASPAIDSVRLDDVWILDLRLARRFRYRTLTVQTMADLFNALNGNAALVRERNLGSPNFDRVTMTVSPRILRLGLRISY
jgi:hypothetical protein